MNERRVSSTRASRKDQSAPMVPYAGGKRNTVSLFPEPRIIRTTKKSSHHDFVSSNLNLHVLLQIQCTQKSVRRCLTSFFFFSCLNATLIIFCPVNHIFDISAGDAPPEDHPPAVPASATPHHIPDSSSSSSPPSQASRAAVRSQHSLDSEAMVDAALMTMMHEELPGLPALSDITAGPMHHHHAHPTLDIFDAL